MNQAIKILGNCLGYSSPNIPNLLAFVSQRIAGPFLTMLDALVPAVLPAPQKLEAILRHALDDKTKDKAVLRLLAQSNQNEQVKQSFRPRILEAITAIVEQGIKDGLFLPHNPAYTSRMFLGCLSELFELQSESAADDAATEYVDVVITAVRQGFSIHVAKVPELASPCPPVPDPEH